VWEGGDLLLQEDPERELAIEYTRIRWSSFLRKTRYSTTTTSAYQTRSRYLSYLRGEQEVPAILFNTGKYALPHRLVF
jgi:hypothetical protein